YAEPIFRLQFCSLILDLTRGTCGKRGCMARIVPNHSAFRKRNQRLSRFLVGLRGNRLTMTAAATATNAVCSANGVQSTRQGQLARRKKGHIIGSSPISLARASLIRAPRCQRLRVFFSSGLTTFNHTAPCAVKRAGIAVIAVSFLLHPAFRKRDRRRNDLCAGGFCKRASNAHLLLFCYEKDLTLGEIFSRLDAVKRI